MAAWIALRVDSSSSSVDSDSFSPVASVGCAAGTSFELEVGVVDASGVVNSSSAVADGLGTTSEGAATEEVASSPDAAGVVAPFDCSGLTEGAALAPSGVD